MELTRLQELARMTDRDLSKKAGVSTGTLYRAKRGEVKRRATMEKIAGALGVEPEDVTQFRDVLDEVFTVVPTPEWDMVRAWELITRGLVRAGHAEFLRERLERIMEEHGDEGRKSRAEAQEAYQRAVDEELEGGQM